MDIVYEDNHIIVVFKHSGEIVQGDKTGDKPLSEYVKDYLKGKYNKPGNVFCGVVHRIDRPTSGLVIFAKTSKALTRLNEMLRKGEIHKTYLAIVEGVPTITSDTLTDYLINDGRNNKTRLVDAKYPHAQRSVLSYELYGKGERYSLLKVKLFTGRKHQIRCQLANIGHPVKGDLKYGARRSNPDGGISLMAWQLRFVHPVSKKEIILTAPLPDEALWHLTLS